MEKKCINIFLAGIITLAGAQAVSARKMEPYQGSRIYWDISTQKPVFPSGNYGRMIQLRDGRLMAVCERHGGGVLVTYSSDEGGTWTSPQLIQSNPSKVPLCVPDLIQLADGSILVGYNPRPSAPYTEDRKYGMRVLRSTDNGQSWSDPIFVYDASHNAADGCWEPSFLQLPSGEIHLYFANEGPFTTSNEQEISLCRSYDGGLTWTDKERVCFRKDHRDGMPVAIITDNNEIVVIVEDNGWQHDFRATTVRCSVEDNWKDWVGTGTSKRNMIFSSDNANYISAAPYLRKLKTGETVASWQGNHDRPQYADMSKEVMYAAVGDANAMNFKAVSQPFGVPMSENALWNSLAVLDDGTVYALTSWRGQIVGIKGYPMTGFEAYSGTPDMDTTDSGKWTPDNNRPVYMGAKTRNHTVIDFLYDDSNIYFHARVGDRTIFTDKMDNDGVFLYFDFENCCDTYPQKGMFQLFMNVDGSLDFYAGNANKWVKSEVTPQGVDYRLNVTDEYYDMKVAVPWSVLGYEKPPVDKLMRCNIEIRDRRDGELILEEIPETKSKQSWTWPEFRLNTDGYGSVPGIESDVEPKALLNFSGNKLNVMASAPVDCVKVYSLSGALLASRSNCGERLTISLDFANQFVITEILFADGTVQHDKVLLQ